jgi:hypothetical protein
MVALGQRLLQFDVSRFIADFTILGRLWPSSADGARLCFESVDYADIAGVLLPGCVAVQDGARG